jgi:hypothetical protein
MFEITVMDRSRDRWVTGWMFGEFDSRQGLGIFLFTTAYIPALGPTQPSIQWVKGKR